MPYIAKKENIILMFDRIAKYYDFLNHLLSLNRDKRWRKKAIDKLSRHNPKTILDVATGTGDLAIEAVRLNPDKIFAVDISEKMLSIAKAKIDKRGLSHKIQIQKSDSEALPFSDETFDAVTVAFGIRNFENLHKGLEEILRVLKKNGMFVILEFSKPKYLPFNYIYNLYFNKILPFIGGIISKDWNAYKYLPSSVNKFPDGLELLKILEEVGFKKLTFEPLSLGICTIYVGQKNDQT